MLKQKQQLLRVQGEIIKSWLLLTIYTRELTLEVVCSLFVSGKKFKKVRILKLTRFIFVRQNFIFEKTVKSELIFPVEGFPGPQTSLEIEILKKNLNFLKLKKLWHFCEIGSANRKSSIFL